MSFGRLGSLGRGFGRLGGGGKGQGIIPGRITAGGGSYVWTGQDASLVIAALKSVAAGAGSYAWTGDDMTPLLDYFVTASGGSYVWTGQNATLTKSGGSLGLQTSCNGFWSFENTSWTDDSAVGTTLTASGSPSTTTGKVGNGASLNGSTQGFSATSNASLVSGGGSFSIQAWVNISGTVGERLLFNKSNDAFGQYEWGLGTRFTSANVWSFVCSNTSTSHFRAEDTVGISTGTWVHLVGTFDSSTGAMILYKNGSAVGSGATLTGTLNSSASAPLGVGKHTTTNLPASGTIDQYGFWKGRVLSASDVTALYNGGAGLSYAAMA